MRCDVHQALRRAGRDGFVCCGRYVHVHVWAFICIPCMYDSMSGWQGCVCTFVHLLLVPRLMLVGNLLVPLLSLCLAVPVWQILARGLGEGRLGMRM
jgi:hypothetical protein